MSVTARAFGRGFELALELDRDDLLPGRLVDGVLAISSRDGGALRAARVTLQGTETWRYDTTTTDAHGRTRTETHTAHEDAPRVPVALLGATTLAPGERREVPFQLPVPALGPATFEGTELRVDWDVTADLDVGGFDPAVVLPVRVLQPTSLLRAGVVDVGPFALFDAADVGADGLAGTLRLDPVPLCVGAPFRGELLLVDGPAREVQEVRLELRVTARSTVSGGREETIPLWTGRLAEAGDFGGRGWTYPFEGTIVGPCLPTIRTAHGRADATFHVIVAVAWAPDPHLVRDVTVCSTTEL